MSVTRRIAGMLMGGAILLGLAILDGRVMPHLHAVLAESPQPAAAAAPDEVYCAANVHESESASAWTSWGVDLNNRRWQSEDMAIARLKLRWALGAPGGATQPAVAGGRVFFGTGAGKVYAVDGASGCIHWIFNAGVRIHTAMTIGASAIFFGDSGSSGAHVYAVDAATGKLIWKSTVDDSRYARVNGTPALALGMLFVPVTGNEDTFAGNPDFECCRFQGSLAALDAVTGRTVWKSSTIPQPARVVGRNSRGVAQWGPSGAGVWSAPTVDLARRAIYVGTGDGHSDPPGDTSDAILAFSMDTGAMLWSQQKTAGDAWNMACVQGDPMNCPAAEGDDLDFGSPPILADLSNGRRALIAGQKSGVVYALDPDHKGRELWRSRLGAGGAGGGIVAGAAVDGRNVYVAVSDFPHPFSRPARHDDPLKRWVRFESTWLWVRATTALRFSDSAGGTFALRVDSGERVWYSPPQCGPARERSSEAGPRCLPEQPGAVTGIGGAVFSGSFDGRMRAYAADDGRVLWTTNTARSFTAVNGDVVHGGEISGSGPVVAGGVLYVNSGGVLLAYSADGK